MRLRPRSAGIAAPLLTLCALTVSGCALKPPPTAKTAPPFLPGVDLVGKDLRDRVTDGANLEYRKLGPVTLRGAHCAAVFADHAIITGADLAGAHLPLLHGVGLWATHANLTRARLWEANLDFADLRHANLSAADLWHASLRSADLRGADLRRARLWGTEFVDADLRGADLTGVVPDGSNFERAVYDSTTRWPSGFDPTLCRRAESP